MSYSENIMAEANKTLANAFDIKVDLEKIRGFFLGIDYIISADVVFIPNKEGKPVLTAQISTNNQQVSDEQVIAITNKMAVQLRGYLLPTRLSIALEIERINKRYYDLGHNYCEQLMEHFFIQHNLPIDKQRQIQSKASIHSFNKLIRNDTYESLSVIAEKYQVSPAIFMQTLFAITVGRFSNESEVVMLYEVISGKDAIDLTEKENDFLILKNELFQNLPFKQQLLRHKQVISLAYSYRDSVKWFLNNENADYEFDMSCFPLKFSFESVSLDKATQAFAESDKRILSDSYYQSDLELRVIESHKELQLTWFYDANLFDTDTIIRINKAFFLLLDGTIQSGRKGIYDYPLITQQEQRALIGEDICQTLDSRQSISSLIEQQVLKTPDNIAVVSEDSKLSYRQMNEQANRLAQYLLEQGVKAETRVGIAMHRSPKLITAIIALLKIGAVYVPLDPDYPESRTSFMINDSKVELVLTNKIGDSTLIHYHHRLLYLDNDNLMAELNRYSSENPIVDSSSKNSLPWAYIMYTSGSTGQPKGTIGTQESVVNRVVWMKDKYPLTHNEVCAVKTTMSSVDHIAEVLQPLISGAACAILTNNESQAKQLAAMIEKYSISRVTLLTSQLKLLLAYKNDYSLKSLKYVMSSGEALYYPLVEEFHSKFNGSAILLNLYGSTEVGADVSCYELDLNHQSKVLEYFKSQSLSPNSNAITDEESFQSLGNTNGTGFTKENVTLSSLLKNFSDSLVPERPQELREYLTLLKENVTPHLIDVGCETYIGHMTSGLPDFIPELGRLITHLNQNTVKIETSKSMTLLERQVLAMMHRLFYTKNQIENSEYYRKQVQNSDAAFGVVTSGGTIANITAIHCARNRGILNEGISQSLLLGSGAQGALQSLGYKDSVILVSKLAHYSVKKAIALLGLGQNNLITIEEDEHLKIKTSALRKQINDCRRNKQFIIAIVGIAGATETGTIDSLDEIADIAKESNIHFHVDAAWGGAFIFSDKYRHKLRGIERADSITFCAHKQLYLAQGISMCLFKDPRSLFSSTTHADYQALPGSFDFGQFTIEGSKPAISLMLHASLHLFAKSGYGWLIDDNMQKTAFFRNVIAESDCFELVGNNDLNIINYRYVPRSLRGSQRPYSKMENQCMNNAVEMIQQQQFLEGKTFVSKTDILHKNYGLDKIKVFRAVIMNPLTGIEHMLRVLNDQLRIASEIIENQSPIESISLKEESARYFQSAATPIGKPINNMKIYILDQYLNLVPTGVIGEMYVAGIGLSKGYLNKPELTRESFIENPYKPEEKLFKSGDLARRLACGNIEFIGRNDRQVKISGLRVELAEIEGLLLALPEISECAVIVKRELQADDYLKAFVVLSLNAFHLDSASLNDIVNRHLMRKLPQYMIPSKIELLESIPLTLSGKVNIQSLN